MKYRPYLVPLQALTALFLCAGMAWLIVVMAGFNPNPPTALDIKMRSTADVSMASLNSTAAALAVQLIAELVPTAIVLPPTASAEITAAPTSTLGLVLIPVSGSSKTPTATPFSLRSLLFPATRTREPAPTRTPVWTLTPPPTNTAIPTLAPTNTTVPTSTPVPTNASTAVPPTATTAPPPETDTAQPPTSTSEPPTEPPTDTSEPPPQNTSEPPPTSVPPIDTPAT